MKILFVCTGNTCRSPMAEALAVHLLTQSRAIPGVSSNEASSTEVPGSSDAGFAVMVRSAGTGADPGAERTHLAGKVLREEGIVVRPGQATPLTRELLEWADVVLGMESKHRDRAQALASAHGLPTAGILTLGEWAGEPDSGVADPYCEGTLPAYREARDGIRRLLEQGLKRHGLRM